MAVTYRYVAAGVEPCRLHAVEPQAGWPEQLASDLKTCPGLRLSQWAESQGLAPETVSRSFKRVFGVSPQRFRLEYRARQAWLRCVAGTGSLTAIAHELGFADLAHMSRSVAALTGRSPRDWRRGDRP